MKRCIVCLALGFLLAAATPAEAQNEWLSKAVSLQGQVEKRRGPETDWVPVRVGDAFGPGDSIKVHKNSRAGLLLQDNTVLRVDQNTTVTFLGEQESQHPLIDLFSGSLHFFTRTKRKLQIKTPFVNAAVEGTEFLMSVDAGQSSILALEGRVRASNPHGSVAVQAGELVVAEEGSAPVGSIALKPMDAVAWTLYYPPLWELGTGRELSARETRIFGRARSVPEALQALEQLEQTPWTRLLRSSLLLQVGRWNEALALVDDVLGQDPANGLALSQRAIIHLVRGEREQAFETAQKADAAGKKSAVPAIALSYVHQARFELEEALLQTGNAVSREPKNALARARRAELLLASGRTAEALDMACGAVALNPELSQTHMVLGFASLSEFRTQEAAAAFEKAILLDQAEPLARLGLGLTMIRENRLEEGREQMEIAMEMDPGNSILRSYLGKSYFAENREEDALNQLDRAKVLDPRDPTPWLYEAFVLQSMNRPTEALLSIKESMERNNNRAVYRSSLLLDKDLASRSSSLAWIYNELGFEQLALKEGWQSVNEHPADFSAHRVLADSYSALPRHEIARVSELLQSQLLQPITVNPVLPHLAESELFIFEDAGPMASGFNEFNALFQRDGIGLLASGVLGGDDTWGDEVVLSGIHDGLSYSLGQFHYETDGFRENNDLDQDIGNVFLQWAATAQTSIQVDYRYRDVERGDLPLRFDRDLAQETLRQSEESGTFRMGLHHAFSPQSDIIGTVAVQEQEFKYSFSLEKDDPFPALFEIDIQEEVDGFQIEAQNLFHFERVDTIVGGGHYKADIDEEESMITLIEMLDMMEESTSESNSEIRHDIIYLYTTVDALLHSKITLGGSYVLSDGTVTENEQLNPKFGTVITPTSDTTVHGAVLRTLQRNFLTGQTIEPTQVAGFSQFFDDEPDAETWLYGLGVHQKFSRKLYGGIKGYHREIEVPFEEIRITADFTPVSNVSEVYWEEDVLRAYLDWIVHPWVTAEAAYLFEEFQRDEAFVGADLFTELTTHQGSLGLRFFHPSGLRAGITGYRVHQEGEFGDPLGGILQKGDDDFWLADASIGYLLANQRGLLSVEVKNLFDTDFQFQSTDPDNPRFYPDLLLLGRVTFRF